jgi:predicted ATPase
MEPTPAQLALLEREADLEHAGRVLARARSGRGGVLLVTGEAGIGKTSLVRRLAAAPVGRWQVLWGACEDLHSPRPLGPLRDIALRVRGPLLQGLEAASAGASPSCRSRWCSATVARRSAPTTRCSACSATCPARR